MRIAVFDSGIGGISVLHDAMKTLPNESYVYFADTLHVPYGMKTADEVRRYIESSVSMLLDEEQVKALVIACNTATSVAARYLRERYDFPIIGMEPAVKPAVEMNRANGKRVLVLATPLTLQQTKYHELVTRVDDRSIVDSLPLPELVDHCEALNFDEARMRDFFCEKFSSLQLDTYGTVVLGCTHFSFYRNILTAVLPDHIRIVDGKKGTVARLQHVLRSQGMTAQHGTGEINWLCSDRRRTYLDKMADALRIFTEMEKSSFDRSEGN